MEKEAFIKVFKFIFRYACITIVSFIYAVAIALFLNPNNLAPGGVTGIAIVAKKVAPFLPGVGMLILIINIPILILGAWKFGLKFIFSTLYTLVVSSIMIDVIPTMVTVKAVTFDPMLASVVGGGLFGLSMGLMFRLETTTGGLDIIVKIIRQKMPYMKSGQIYIILDIGILVASAFAFGNIEVALFAGIAIYVASAVMDRTLYGGDEATLVYIVSTKRKILAVRMLKEVNVGVTMIQAMGAYSNEKTEVIMCVMKKQQLVKVRNILKETDPEAFMIVSSANEVFGQGFKNQYNTEI